MQWVVMSRRRVERCRERAAEDMEARISERAITVGMLSPGSILRAHTPLISLRGSTAWTEGLTDTSDPDTTMLREYASSSCSSVRFRRAVHLRYGCSEPGRDETLGKTYFHLRHNLTPRQSLWCVRDDSFQRRACLGRFRELSLLYQTREVSQRISALE